MRRLVAPNFSYRVLALLCFGLGACWYYWYAQKEPENQSRILVQPLPTPKTLLEVRQLISGGEYGGHINTCGAYFYEDENPKLTYVARLREKACLIESEEARKFILKNWKEKKKSYIEIDYPCPDCRPVYDVLIEQNKNGEWQMTIRKEPDRWDSGEPKEFVAVSLKRRRATEYDEQKHVVGELILVFEDAEGDEILTL